MSIRNDGAAVKSWALAWSFLDGQVITNAWNTTATQSGASVRAADAGWNAKIATGGSASFGFQADHSGANRAPAAFSLNGVPCSLG